MLLIVTAVTLIDIIGVLKRIWVFFLSGDTFNLSTFWTQIVRGKPHPLRVHSSPYSPFEDSPELSSLVEDLETYEPGTGNPHTSSPPSHFHEINQVKNPPHAQSDLEEKEHNIRTYGHRVRASYMRHSYHSEQSTSSTLHEEDDPAHRSFPRLPQLDTSLHDDKNDDEVDDFDAKFHERRGKLSRFVSMTVYLTEWLLVGLAFAQLLSGVSVYSGICHGRYINGCLAHFISK